MSRGAVPGGSTSSLTLRCTRVQSQRAIKRLVNKHMQRANGHGTEPLFDLRGIEGLQLLSSQLREFDLSKSRHYLETDVLLVSLPCTRPNLGPHDLKPSGKIHLDRLPFSDDEHTFVPISEYFGEPARRFLATVTMDACGRREVALQTVGFGSDVTPQA